MKVLDRLHEDHLLGVRFAVNVFIASIIVWITLRFFAHASPIWAIASMIASSEPVVKQGLKMFRSRLINIASRLRSRATLPVGWRAECLEAPLRARDHSAARIVRRSDPGDVASGADHRGDRHRRQPAGALEDRRRRERAAARERSDLRLCRRVGGELAHGEDLAGAGL
jgi:hypothetical protein